MKENIEEVVERLEKSINDVGFSTTYSQEDEERDLQTLLSDYKRLQEEFKQVDNECFRLEQKELRLEKENEELKSDNLEYQRIQDIFDERKYRKKYLEERRAEQPKLLYPDADEIYERYYKLKEENEELKHKYDKALSDLVKAEKENEELKERWDKDTHKLQNDLDIANAEKIELQKENEKLKKFIIEGITIEPNSPYKNYQLDFLRENFISVQKVQDKIEELNKKEKQELKGTKGQDRYDIKQQYMYQRNILQNLLEEKGE